MSSENAQIPAIYQEAIRRYEETTKKQLDGPALPKMTSVDGLLKEIEQQNNQFNDFRETRHTFFAVLESAMRPIEQVGIIATGAASMAFPPSSLVFGAVNHLIDAAKGVSSSYDAIQDLLGSLKDFTVQLRIYSREHISKELGDLLSDILVTLIEILALSRKTIKGGRFRKFARNVLVGSDDQIRAAVSQLGKLTETHRGIVSAETLTGTKRTGRVLDDVSVTVATTNLTVHETSTAVGAMSLGVTELNEKVDNLMVVIDQSRNKAAMDQDKGRQDVAKRLLEPSVTAQDWYDKINKSRVSGTGDWIRSEDFFKSWTKRNIPILWVSGNPGAGKSYLSSNIISFLKDQHPQGVQHPSHVSVGYFFFKDDNPKTRSFHQALRDLAYQVSQNDPVYAKYLSSSSLVPDDIHTLTSAWRSLFVEFFIKKPDVRSSIYLILDGVDEAYDEERQVFLELVKDITESRDTRIQVAIVGRPHLSDHISEALEREVPTIHVTDVKNSADIIRYIESSIHKSSILRRVSAKLRSEIVAKLSAGAQGMFIWVDLMLRELLKKRSESTIRKSLDEAPKGLKEILRHVLESFSSNSTEDEPENLNELLAWVTCAQRPLALGELDTILKLKSPDGDGMIYLEGALRKQFASFFSLTREDRLATAELQHMNQVNDSDNDQGGNSQEEGFEDVDNVTDFDSDPTTTQVTLCHASIGDFFRDETEGQVSAGDGHPAIGVEFKEARFNVLNTCLELFCDELFRKKSQDSGHSILPYAYKNWLSHLQAVDPSKLDIEQRKQIAILLAKMFTEEAVIANFAGNVTRSFMSNDTLKLVRKWLGDTEIEDFLPFETHESIRTTSGSPTKVLERLARYIGKRWLADLYWLPLNCCQIVYSYICLEKGTPLDDSFTGFTTAEEIFSVAEWLNLDKDALWHRRLAMALREIRKYDKCLEHFKKAIELDSTMWIARAGIAVVHSSRGEYQAAIDLDTVTELELQQSADIPRDTTSAGKKMSLHLIQERMASSYEALGNKEMMFVCYKNARGNNPGCDPCTCKVLLSMHERGLHGDIIDLLKAMQNEDVPGKEYSRLTSSLWLNRFEDEVYYRIVSGAAFKIDELKFLVEAYRAAIRAARKELKTVFATSLEISLANLYYVYTGEQHKAIRIWNKVIDTFTGSRGESELGYNKLTASMALARHTFREALHAGIDSLEAEKHVKVLEKLAKTPGLSADDESIAIIPAYPAIILGMWYRLNGMHEEANSCFRPSIREAIEILSDDDPDNDEQGFYELMTVLIAAGDFDSTIALLYSFGEYDDDEESNDDDSNTEGSETSDDDDDSDNEMGECSCDGPCHRWFDNYDNLYVCKYCFDILFCEDCLKLLKTNDMPMDVCSHKHDWLFIPPNPQKNEKGKLLIDGAMVDVGDWKEKLKEQWKV